MSGEGNSFRHKLNNLAQQIFHHQNAVTWYEKQEEPQHTGNWLVETKVNHQVYGRGTARTVNAAREMAAEQAYFNLRRTYNIRT